MTRIENGCETDTGLQRLDHTEVNLVVNNMASLLVVDRVDDFVVSIILVAVKVLGLTAVTCDKVSGKLWIKLRRVHTRVVEE